MIYMDMCQDSIISNVMNIMIDHYWSVSALSSLVHRLNLCYGSSLMINTWHIMYEIYNIN